MCFFIEKDEGAVLDIFSVCVTSDEVHGSSIISILFVSYFFSQTFLLQIEVVKFLEILL